MSEDWASHNVDKTCFKNFNQCWVSEFLQRMLSNKITFCKSWFLIQIMLTLNEIYFWHKCCLFPFFLVETSEKVFRWIIVHDDNYVDLSDLYVDLSVIYVDLSDHYVELSEKYHDKVYYLVNLLLIICIKLYIYSRDCISCIVTPWKKITRQP